jgi:four helix bundle protein
MRDIKGYDVYKLADRLVLRVYRASGRFPKSELFALTSQIRRAAYSIPMNLVEGAARRSAKEFARSIDIAIGSCEEVRYQLRLSAGLGYLGQDEVAEMDADYEKVKQMLTKLLARVSGRSAGVSCPSGERSADSG